MRLVTIVSLGASAVLGLAALVVAKAVLPNTAAAKDKGQQAQVVAGVPVVVAAHALKYGDRLDAGALTIARLPANAVPEGAFTTVAAVLAQDHGGAPVVLFPLAAREPLLAAKLSGPGARPSVAAEIADGMRAFTIKVDDVTGVGGHALPGDRVDVVLARDLTPNGERRSWVSEVVLQNVRVLAIDLNADLSSNKPAAPSTATLEVAVPDSQKLAIAADAGKLSLALRRTGSAEVAATGPMRTGSFSSAGDAAGSAPRTVVYRARSASQGSGLIQIVEGEGRGAGNRQSRMAAPAPAADPAKTAEAAGQSAAAVKAPLGA
jgi:pilus assembly protein CpaB